jgi:hypothetical protein
VIQTGRQLGIRGTPYLFLEGGEPLRGFLDAQRLEQRFKERGQPSRTATRRTAAHMNRPEANTNQ